MNENLNQLLSEPEALVPVRRPAFWAIADDLEAYTETLLLVEAQLAECQGEDRPLLEAEKIEITAKLEQLGAALVEKADACAGVRQRTQTDISVMKSDEERMYRKRKAAERALEWLDGYLLKVMQEHDWKHIKTPKVTIARRTNGGVLPLEIDANPASLPDDCCRMEGWVRADLWELALDLVRSQPGPSRGTRINDYSMMRVPDNATIRAELTEPCSACDSGGRAMIGWAVECTLCHRTKCPRGRSVPMEMANSLCDHECPGYSVDPEPGSLWPREEAHSGMTGPVCGNCKGTGKTTIPGARLGVRGEHIRCL